MTQQERLRYLLEGLVAEYKEKYNEHIDIPVSEEEQFTLFRALCNIRPAGAMSAEWMKIEDEYLNILAHEKGIVTIMSSCSVVFYQITNVLIMPFILLLVLSYVWPVLG